MKLNHLNLVVADVAAAINLFTTYFGFTIEETKGDNVVAALRGTDDFSLVLMSAAMSKQGTLEYPEAFHIGFFFERKEQINDLFEKLKAGGVPLPREPRKIRDSFGFYFHFENIMIEIGYYAE